MHVVLERTNWGATHSRSAAIRTRHFTRHPVRFHLTSVYAIAGALTGLSGMIQASRLMSGQPTGGAGLRTAGHRCGGNGGAVCAAAKAVCWERWWRVHHGLAVRRQRPAGDQSYWQQAIIGAVIILRCFWMNCETPGELVRAARAHLYNRR